MLEVFYKPLFGLVVDELVVMADAGFAQPVLQGSWFRHDLSLQGIT